ncbi:MAG TPA: hypothetical protein VN281_05015 [Verrucomicrobiae bacterium]|nr:hypothetical protein [Verrucomicrobiae bacterium]
MKTKILMLCAAIALAGCTNSSDQGGTGTGTDINTNRSSGGAYNTTNSNGGTGVTTNNPSNAPK